MNWIIATPITKSYLQSEQRKLKQTMRIPGIRKLQRITRWFRNRFTTKGLILMYHSINGWDSDPWSLCVNPNHFAEHLEVLQKYSRPIKLQQLVQALRYRDLPHRTVVVTFDDGYADNLYNAKPLLERHNIPSTFFLTTGYIGCQREFWWDELDRLLLQPGKLPDVLCLKINGSIYEWKLGNEGYYSEDEYKYNRDRRAWEGGLGSRHSLYYSILQVLRPLPESEQRKALDEILKWSNTAPVTRPTHRSLSLEEMLALGQGELIEIGSHTVRHPVLSALPTVSQRNEIQTSKFYLEDALGYSVTSFSYPHGEYTEVTAALVREAGFACACSITSDVVCQRTDLFQLPRLQVEDWDGDEFARRLLWWFNS